MPKRPLTDPLTDGLRGAGRVERELPVRRDMSKSIEVPFAALPEDKRREAMARLAVLRPTFEEEVPPVRAAAEAGVPIRTAQRWLARYRKYGMQA